MKNCIYFVANYRHYDNFSLYSMLVSLLQCNYMYWVILINSM